jgi:predicted ABC-type ATPase
VNRSRPKLLIVAGANGAGKSTLTKRWTRRLHRLGPVLDPDEIAKGINPIHPALAGIRAARTVLERTTTFLNEGSSFVIETTLSDRNRHLDLIERAHEHGFRVWLLYVGLEKSQLHLNRVADRVRGGGHDVPDADILRRLSRSLGNLPEALRRVDRALLYDNSGRSMRLVASVQSGITRGATGTGWWTPILKSLESFLDT